MANQFTPFQRSLNLTLNAPMSPERQSLSGLMHAEYQHEDGNGIIRLNMLAQKIEHFIEDTHKDDAIPPDYAMLIQNLHAVARATEQLAFFANSVFEHTAAKYTTVHDVQIFLVAEQIFNDAIAVMESVSEDGKARQAQKARANTTQLGWALSENTPDDISTVDADMVLRLAASAEQLQAALTAVKQGFADVLGADTNLRRHFGSLVEQYP